MCWSLTSTFAWPNPACWGSPEVGRCHAEWLLLAQPVFVSLQVSESLTEMGVKACQWSTRTVLVGWRLGPPGERLVDQHHRPPGRGWRGSIWCTRIEAGGQCVDAPGQRLVASISLISGLFINRGMELAARLTELVLDLSLAMSEACLWACQGSVVSTCRYDVV